METDGKIAKYEEWFQLPRRATTSCDYYPIYEHFSERILYFLRDGESLSKSVLIDCIEAFEELHGTIRTRRQTVYLVEYHCKKLIYNKEIQREKRGSKSFYSLVVQVPKFIQECESLDLIYDYTK